MDEVVAAPAAPVYGDEDLVYVDPDTRTVVGKVEWNTAGRPKSLPMKVDEPVEAKDENDPKAKRHVRRQRFYPWGTYRSMKRIFKLEGKQPKQEAQNTLDEILEKALKEPFWN